MPHRQNFPRGIYLITPDSPDTSSLLATLDTVLSADASGIVAVQYRAKTLPPTQSHARAQAVLELCRRHDVPMLVNDSLDLALAIGADGVHLGMGDGSLAEARARLGAEAVVGATCHADLARAHAALAEGASYVAFGAMYPSSSKPRAARAPLALLGEARAALPAGVPIAAIGGIDVHNAAAVARAGADWLCVISAVFDAPDPAAAVRALMAAFAS